MGDEIEERKRRGFLAFLAMVVFVALQLIAIQTFTGNESGLPDAGVFEVSTGEQELPL